MKHELTLGSLFDGIGGFCLAGRMANVHPVWASEIEPFPIRVTQKRFPDVEQLGDVHSIDGAGIPAVDIITFGSPCQNLSIAGKRAGLDGNQSSLFYEAVRIIREMRNATNGKYPKWAVWENVPGALSSNDGQDFRQVLQSLISIADESADVPMPEDGKWLSAGEIVADNSSLAWRILDASKGWGVAQRRRRVFAVLDLTGERAGQVLFESEGVSRYTPPGSKARKESAGISSSCPDAAGFKAIDYYPADSRITLKDDGICQTLTARLGTGGNNVPLTMKIRSGCSGGGKDPLIQTDLSATLSTHADQTLFEPKVYGISADQSNSMLSDNPHSGVYEADTSRTLDCNGGNPACNQGGMAVVQSYSLQGSMIGRKDENGPQGDGINTEIAFTLNTIDRHAVAITKCDHLYEKHSCHADSSKNDSVVGAYGLDRASYNQGANAQFSIGINQENSPALVAKGPGAVSSYAEQYLVRRLTPDECCRLQGYPDGWHHGLSSESPAEAEIQYWEKTWALWDEIQGRARPRTKAQVIRWLQHPNSDAAEYKAYGNSVAVPCVFFVLAGIIWVEEKEEIP